MATCMCKDFDPNGNRSFLHINVAPRFRIFSCKVGKPWKWPYDTLHNMVLFGSRVLYVIKGKIDWFFVPHMTQGRSTNIHVMTQHGPPKQCQALYHKFKFCNHVCLWPEWTENHEHTTMDGWCKDMTFFSIGFLFLADGLKNQGSKSVQGVLKLGFIQLFGLHNRKMRWCIHGCWVTLAIPLELHDEEGP